MNIDELTGQILGNLGETYGQRAHDDDLVSPEDMWGAGFEMDCGESFRQLYGSFPSTSAELRALLPGVGDPVALGSLIFSQWRYWTHWSGECVDEDGWLWFKLTAQRLQELGKGHSITPPAPRCRRSCCRRRRCRRSSGCRIGWGA